MAPHKIYDPKTEPSDIRRKAIEMLDVIVGHEQTSKYLEMASWNHTVTHCTEKNVELKWDNFTFRNSYTQKILSVRYWLKLRPDLVELMKTGETSVKKFVNSKPWEIVPEKWEKAFDEVAKKELRFADANSMDVSKMQDGLLTCGKCKSKKTNFFEKQTRGADEPMTGEIIINLYKCIYAF
jgi:DNA-directed RNA polymerase subunit M/transcription elongation factor TFIIS